MEPSIPDLRVVKNALTKEQHDALLANIQGIWGDMHTFVQYCTPVVAVEYGWQFDRTCAIGNAGKPVKPLTKDDKIEDIPEWLKDLYQTIREKLGTDILPEDMCDHTMLNKYEVGVGLPAHVDEPIFWGDWVVGVCVGSGTTMRWSKGEESYDLYLPPGTAYLFYNRARYQWKHEVVAADSDIVDGVVIPRNVRYAVTFRNISESILTEDTKDSVKTETAKERRRRRVREVVTKNSNLDKLGKMFA